VIAQRPPPGVAPRPQLSTASTARDLPGHQPGLDRQRVGLYHLHVGAPRIDYEGHLDLRPEMREVAFSPLRTSNILTATTAS